MIEVLPFKYEKHISEFIEKKFQHDKLDIIFSKQLIREDVLDILGRYCVIVYYPIDGDRNNGFHVENFPIHNSNKKHFVFINTAQSLEKQIFTAAHELGHIWNVDEIIHEVCCPNIEFTKELSESIISRFAATLLMPQDAFTLSTNEIIESLKLESTQGDEIYTIDYNTALKLVVILMNKFFVPMKSVIIRLVELNFLDVNDANLLLGNTSVPEEIICRDKNEIISEMKYDNLNKPTRRKWIEGLPELLNKAEKLNVVSQDKIDNMRAIFELNKTTEAERNEVITITASKGNSNANQ